MITSLFPSALQESDKWKTSTAWQKYIGISIHIQLGNWIGPTKCVYKMYNSTDIYHLFHFHCLEFYIILTFPLCTYISWNVIPYCIISSYEWIQSAEGGSTWSQTQKNLKDNKKMLSLLTVILIYLHGNDKNKHAFIERWNWVKTLWHVSSQSEVVWFWICRQALDSWRSDLYSPQRKC